MITRRAAPSAAVGALGIICGTAGLLFAAAAVSFPSGPLTGLLLAFMWSFLAVAVLVLITRW